MAVTLSLHDELSISEELQFGKDNAQRPSCSLVVQYASR